jgi:two-component system phosphate regulon sensor histidine kinase PhoR
VRLGIRGKLFLVSLALITASVAIADFWLTSALDADMSVRVRDELITRLQLMQRDVTTYPATLDDRARWDALADDLGKRAQGRVTVIRADGTVLGDSDLDLTEIEHVENHAGRPEVKEALALARGSSVRFSSTLRRRMMYAASRQACCAWPRR